MKKINQTYLTAVIIVILILGIVLFYNPTPKETIKIGVLADLSGDYASFLRGVPRGVELAVEDLQKEIDREIKLIIEDQKSCDTKETVTIMNKLVNIDGVDIIIGGTCSSTTLAAAPIAEQAKTIMISPSSSAPSISNAGDYIFRTYISDVTRAKKIAELAYNLGKRKMAMIIDINNDMMVELGENAKETFLSKGGEVIAQESIKKDDVDFRTQITKIKSLNPDVIFLAVSGPNQNGLIIKQLRELAVDLQIISPSETVGDPQVIEIAGNLADGLIYAVPGNPPITSEYKELENRYNEKYNEEIPSYMAEAYDAVMLGVKAVLASDGTKEDINDKLFEVSRTYEGVSGNVTFDENGDVVKSVMFKTIKNSQFVPYEE